MVPATTTNTKDASSPPAEEVEASTAFFSLFKSFLRRASFWASVYTIGALKMHVGWILLPLSISAYLKYRKIARGKRKRLPPVKVCFANALPICCTYCYTVDVDAIVVVVAT